MLSKNTNKRFRLGNRPGNAAAMTGKRALNLALFLSPASDQPPPFAPKSPRSFDDGAVGLGIVAAMSAGGGGGDAKPAPPPAPARSEPIPIVSPQAGLAARPKGSGWEEEEDDDDELSESYTCVISHVAGNTVRKRVYFDDGAAERRTPGVFFQSPPPPREQMMPSAGDFLISCYLCRKRLHGLDIFMYRGDKAFCSSECRCQQILGDEYRENCGPGALKSFENSVSPLLFVAGVAAA